MVKCHLEHVSDDTYHDEVLKGLIVNEFRHATSTRTKWRFVTQRMIRLCLDNKTLQLEPVELLLSETKIFFLLCLLILEEEHTNEEVQEEKAADEDEDHEENSLSRAIFILWPVVTLRHVNGLVHDIGPTL